jgi:hypothetical protein
MKSLLLFGLATLVLIAMFGDGGLEVSPTVSPALKFSPNLEFKPNVSYAPETTTNTTRIDTNIESQTNIETNIENQTVIVQAAPSSVTSGAVGGSSTVNPAYNLCQPSPGETIVQKPDSKGACVVQDGAGNRYFINAAGVKWLLGNAPTTALQAPDNGLSLDQLQAAFLRNGGQLPWFWDTRSEAAQMDWLKEQAETWK